jgi:hypothetical protein
MNKSPEKMIAELRKQKEGYLAQGMDIAAKHVDDEIAYYTKKLEATKEELGKAS